MNGSVFDNRGAKHTKAGSVAARFNQNSVLLNGKNTADNSSRGNNLVGYLKIINHLLHFIGTLFFGADNQEVENNDH